MKKTISFVVILSILALLLTGCSHEHKFTSWRVSVEPTCSENGLKVRTCEICNETEETIIPMTEHKWVDATVEEAKHCEKCGYTDGYPLVIVPEIDGLTIDEIKTKLSTDGFNLIESTDYSDEIKKDDVIAIEPASGAIVEHGSDINLIISCGKFNVVPNVKKLSLTEATKKLEALGLTVSTSYEYSDSIGENKIISFSPEKYGNPTQITLVVSKGKGVTVPNVTGMSISDAKKKLEKLGLKCNVIYSYPSMYCSCNNTKASVKAQNFYGLQKKGSNVTLTCEKNALAITRCDIDLNYVGGVNTEFTIKNLSDKQIAYVNLTVKCYDRMGKPANCEINHTSTAILSYTGPLRPGKTDYPYWEAYIYDNTVAVVEPISAVIEFTDGTKQVLTYTGLYWYTRDYYGGNLKN